MTGHGQTIPPALLRRDNRVLRPRDAADVYRYPRAEFARLSRARVLLPLATGYFAVVPPERWASPRWRPDLDAVALGIARADYPADTVALMGTSAARHHGALPRALAVAVVAVPKQRPELATAVGRIRFVTRDTVRLDLERIDTELGTGWVTTVEQTLLDLAGRFGSGALAPADLRATLRALGTRADWDVVQRLAAGQHRPAALNRAREAAA